MLQHSVYSVITYNNYRKVRRHVKLVFPSACLGLRVLTASQAWQHRVRGDSCLESQQHLFSEAAEVDWKSLTAC